MRAHVLVNVSIRTEREIAKAIRHLTHRVGGSVEEIDMVFGDIDLLFTVEIPDNAALSEVIAELHKDHPSIRTIVYVVAETDFEAEEAVVAGSPA